MNKERQEKNEILRGQGREYYQNFGNGNKNHPRKLLITEKTASKSHKYKSDETENYIRFIRLQEALGTEGSDFVLKLHNSGIKITSDNIREITNFFFENEQPEPKPITIHKGGKKIGNIPVGPEQTTRIFKNYNPPESDSNTITYERTTLLQRMRNKVFKK